MKRLPSPAEIALTASAVAITGGMAYFLTTRKGGVLTGTYANPLPVPSSSAIAKRIPAVAERLKRVWPELTGEKNMPPEALEIALAQAWGESGVGGWWTDKTDKGQGNMIGSENLGARQCSRPTDSADYYTCVPYGDTIPQPDGSQKSIDASFMYFRAGKTPDGKERDAAEAAAWQFIKDITKTWPALAELKSGDVMAYAKRQGPKAQGGNGYYQGFGATMDERVTGYARAIASHIPAVAAALGHKKVYAKILPELLATGPKYKPTAGVQLSGTEIAQALHFAGLLPRARIIPGTRGQMVVWYVERTDLAGPPRDVVISEQEAAEQDAIVTQASETENPDVEGIGTVVIGIFVGILVAGGIAAAVARNRAVALLGKVRAAGYDVVLPSAKARDGWIIVEASDPGFTKIREVLGDDLFEKALAAGIKFQKPVKTAGYASSRWGRGKPPPVGDLAEDIFKFGTTVLETAKKASESAPESAQPVPPVAPIPVPVPVAAPTVSPGVANAAIAAGAAAAVLVAVALAWRIAKPRLGDAAPVYPAFAWMNGLPDGVVSTLRSGAPPSEDQINTLTIDQCETIVDHALLVSNDGVPDPSTWILLGDGQVALGGIAEAVQAASLAVVGVVALVGAISLHRFLTSATGTKDLSDAAKKAGAFTGLTDPFKHEFTSPAGQKCTQEIGPFKTRIECAPVSEPAEIKKRSRTERISWLLDNAGDPGDILNALRSTGVNDPEIDLRAFMAAATHQATAAHLVIKGSHSWDEEDAAYQSIMLWWANNRGEARSKIAAAEKNWRALVGIAADFCELKDPGDSNCPLLRSYEKTGDTPTPADDTSVPWWHPVRWLAGVEPDNNLKPEARWLRWLNRDIGDAQTSAAEGKKAVDAIADRYASKDAAKVVGSTTGGLLTGLGIGAALGTAFPGIGNVVGAAVGAIIGALAGLISGILSLGPSPEQIALAEEINKFNTQVHVALATVPIDARTKIGMILLDGMRKRPGNIPICVGPGAQERDLGCVMTSIEGIRDAAVGLDENVKKWILEYEREKQTKKTRAYKRVAVATGITLAALAAVAAVAVKTGVVAIGDAEPRYPEFPWMTGFPPDAITTLRAGVPLGSAALRRLTRDQRRTLAAHADVDTTDGAIDLATWKITE